MTVQNGWSVTLWLRLSLEFGTGVQPTPDAYQSVDEAGFRPGYSTTDHMYTFQQLGQEAAEWHQTLWVAANEFKQTVDMEQLKQH